MLLRPGDYVVVNEGVWDDQMPKDRRDGLVVEMLGQYGVYRTPDQAVVMFHNGVFLKFHVSQLTLLKSLNKKGLNESTVV